MAQILSDMGNSEGANEYLRKMADDISKNPPEDTNGGHNALMEDLTALTKEAFDYEFHDFKNQKYAAPKATLAQKLFELRNNVINGKYDN